MKSLFPPAFNWSAYVGIALVIRVLFIDVSGIAFVAVLLALHQFMLLFDAVGKSIPVRYMFGAFMALQYFIGPTLAYNGLDEYAYFVYRMKVPEMEYFSYAIPGVMAFIVGLHVSAGNLKGEVPDEQAIRGFVERNSTMPYLFIGVGFLASVFGDLLPSALALVAYLLGSFKFIGLFLLILGGIRLKVGPLILVLGSIISSSLSDGMFHDLLTWLVFVGAVYAYKFKLGAAVKLTGAFAFIVFAVFIQVIKGSYRDATWYGEAEGGLGTFISVYQKATSSGQSLFSFENLADKNVRINQGFIMTNVMYTVPERVPYANGEELWQILEAAFLPRLIAPNKLQAGDRKLFTKYSGIQLRKGTSMGLGSLADGYINFGPWGGVLFMFVLGWVYSWLLNIMHGRSKEFPMIILFSPLIFYYPIRPDCELQTALGHFVKAGFLVFVVLYVFRDLFHADQAFRKERSRQLVQPPSATAV